MNPKSINFLPKQPQSLLQLDCSNLKKRQQNERAKILTCHAIQGVSIVVPTFKRVALCQRLLASLQDSQQHVAVPVEIALIDNSPPTEAQKIQMLCEEYGARYFFRPIGVGAKRNFGAKLARYPIILFIDSDCEATPQLIEQHLDVYQNNQQVVATLGPTQFKGPKNFLWQVLQWTPFLIPFRLADEAGQRVWGPSNNLSCRKAIFEQVGGFDETLPNKPGGEDVDFGYRLYKAGHLFSTNPQATIYHTTETWNTVGQVVTRLFHWGQGEFYLYYNHGEYLHYDCPKGLALGLLMLPIALAMPLLTQDLTWLLMPLLFLAVNFASRLLLHLVYHPERWLQGIRVLCVEILVLVYELGLTVQCLKQRWFIPLYNRLIIMPEDAIAVWNQQVLYTWVLFAQLIVTVLLFQWIQSL